jgi:two-component system copper resistance phosphate regulon response regulator CusR
LQYSLPVDIQQNRGSVKPRDSKTDNILPYVNPSRARRILFVEEDTSLASFLSSELRSQGFDVDHLTDAEEALGRLEDKNPYDLLILELNLSKLDGITLIKRIRPILPKLPVLVVTARNRVEDKVLALQTGADDCVTKPLSLAELIARVGALLRRNTGHVPSCTAVADLVLYREERRVERAGRRIELTPREFALLDVMMQNAGHPVPRSTLMELVWNVSSEPSTNIVDVYMKYVRDKVDQPGQPKLIHTVRGFGYEIRPN